MRIHLSVLFNWLLFLAVILVLVILETSFINVIFPSYLVPDFVTVMVMYVGMKRGLGEGVLFTFIMAYLYSLNSGLGFIPASFFQLIVLFLARYISSNFYVSTAKDFILSITALVFIQKLIMLMWLNWSNWMLLLSFIPQIVSRTIITAAVGYFIFRLLYRIDVLTHRIELESLEDNRGLI